MTIEKRDPRVSSTPDAATRRLTNIRPREVSLVDAAANGMEFLIIKRKDAMKRKDQTLFKNADGTETSPTASGGEEAPKKPDEQTDPPQEAASTQTTETSEVSIQKERVFSEQVEKDLEGVPLLKALASEQKDMFMAMSGALVNVAQSLDLIRNDLMAFSTSDGGTAFMGEPIEKLTDDVRKRIEGVEDGLTDQVFVTLLDVVEKKGRKMKKTRLEKLKGIMSGLANLVKELETESASGSANGGSSVNKDEQGSGEGTQTETGAATTEENVEKSAEEKLSETIEAAVTKAVQPLQERIEKLEGSPQPAASEGAESTEEVNKNEGKEKPVSIFKGIIR